jgi:hypothetical protein
MAVSDSVSRVKLTVTTNISQYDQLQTESMDDFVKQAAVSHHNTPCKPPVSFEEDRASTPTPRLLSQADPQRRQYVLRLMRKSIPILAEARKNFIKKNAAYASLCIQDAFQGRLSNGLANNSKKSKWIYTIFCLQTSDLMYNTVIFASTIHTLSLFLEPANVCPNSVLLKIFQIAVILIYAVDISLKMSYEGWQVSL